MGAHTNSTPAAARWFEVMPAIPLARAVPVVAWSRGSIVRVPSFEDGTRFYWGGDVDYAAAPWRVDLADPQGFAYAIRKGHDLAGAFHIVDYFDSVADSRGYSSGDALLLSILCGQESATDADRVALATALAEVSR
jgi:hypothetical protein